MKKFSDETRKRMSESAKKRCDTEWLKKQHARETPIQEGVVRDMYESNMTQYEISIALGVSQKVIWRHMKNHNIVPRGHARRNQCGQANTSWNGGRTIESGYVMVKTDDHPRASVCGGYVPEHILIVEKHLGRYLIWDNNGSPTSEVVHHKNGIKNDNRVENLFVCNFADHMKLHRAIAKGVTVTYDGSTFVLRD